jgi:hypothetical protein
VSTVDPNALAAVVARARAIAQYLSSGTGPEVWVVNVGSHELSPADLLMLSNSAEELRANRFDYCALMERYDTATARIRELEGEAKAHKQVADRVREQSQELRDLRTRCAELERDGKRLDWLQFARATIWWGGILKRRDGPVAHAVSLEWAEDGGLCEQSERFETLRDAIDAARRRGEEG